jgi:hypothetical protein
MREHASLGPSEALGSTADLHVAEPSERIGWISVALTVAATTG